MEALHGPVERHFSGLAFQDISMAIRAPAGRPIPEIAKDRCCVFHSEDLNTKKGNFQTNCSWMIAPRTLDLWTCQKMQPRESAFGNIVVHKFAEDGTSTTHQLRRVRPHLWGPARSKKKSIWQSGSSWLGLLSLFQAVFKGVDQAEEKVVEAD